MIKQEIEKNLELGHELIFSNETRTFSLMFRQVGPEEAAFYEMALLGKATFIIHDNFNGTISIEISPNKASGSFWIRDIKIDVSLLRYLKSYPNREQEAYFNIGYYRDHTPTAAIPLFGFDIYLPPKQITIMDEYGSEATVTVTPIPLNADDTTFYSFEVLHHPGRNILTRDHNGNWNGLIGPHVNVRVGEEINKLYPIVITNN